MEAYATKKYCDSAMLTKPMIKILDNFDTLAHKYLNAELKILYTAITRAKRNLWICDNLDIIPSIYEYWTVKQLTRSVTTSKEDLVFAAHTENEQWKKQGDYMLRKGQLDQAMLCYTKADAKAEVNETQGYIKFKDEEYTEAALHLLEANKILQQRSLVIKIAKCLQAQKCHLEAARLFERAEQVTQYVYMPTSYFFYM